MEKYAFAPVGGNSPYPAEPLHVRDGAGDGGERDACFGGGIPDRQDRMRLRVLKYAQDGSGREPERFDLAAVPIQHAEAAGRCGTRLPGGALHPGEEEVEPRLPVSGRAHAVEEFVVCPPIGLEVEAQIENRLPQRAARAQQKRDEQTPQPAVAVEEWVDRLELYVGQAGLDQQR